MKIGFLITARLKSSRLPLKVIMDLNGKTVIERLIDRIKEIHDISDIVLCTSTHPQDRPLVEIAKKNDIYYFCGDEVDVLKRLYDAGRFFGLDYFIGITADNPLISIYYSNRIIDEIKKSQYDFIEVKGLPFGSATYGMNMKALETICAIKGIVDTEIWGSLIRRPEVFSLKTIEAKGVINRPDLRFTLDYIEDYELIRHLYSSVPFTNVLNLLDVIQYLEKNPHIAEINKTCIQLDIDDEIKTKIDEYYSNNLKKILEIKKRIYESC
ncbi:MAG: 3-deoxy-manno-octulosonate cytidylyltransferase [Methanomicrobiales archaeon]|jgi:spore coat polysaccharide biosynthesis protein SpsF|nr:3-deoxy-manno-octulosonate cytidylyltransferase [Methanomicrobiales archaeon]